MSFAEQPTLDAFSEQAPPPNVLIYTDGGCDPNPGPGGWAAVLQIHPPEDAPSEVVLTGNHPETTNNRMELEAALAALAYLNGRYGECQIELHTDSRYLRTGISQWIDRWMANGWQTRGQQAVKNRDLWRRLYELAASPDSTLAIDWRWVKGHAGDPLNERVDRLATEARARLSVENGLSPESTSASPSVTGQVDSSNVQVSVAVACPGARGPGGWAAVLSSGAAHKVLTGYEPETTSSQLALQAARAGLEALIPSSRVTLYTTEEYLAKGASEWVHGWRQRGWTTSSNKPVQHREQWEALLQAAAPHDVAWQFVPKRALTADLAEAKQAAAQAAQAP